MSTIIFNFFKLFFTFFKPSVFPVFYIITFFSKSVKGDF
nr:MAG TPA: hypothetical protein [Caudoviricetes sp.]